MCDPVTLAVMSAGVSMMGTLASGSAAYGQAKMQADMAAQNARLSEAAAVDAIERGDKAAARHYRELSQLKGNQIAAAAASGIDTGFGSAVEIQIDTAILGNEDANIIRENAMREAKGLRIDAWNYRAQRNAAKAAASQAVVSTVIGMASAGLGGATQISGMGKVGGADLGKAPGTSGSGMGKGGTGLWGGY